MYICIRVVLLASKAVETARVIHVRGRGWPSA